jgi:dTDP-glucose 4,6-dehydratase
VLDHCRAIDIIMHKGKAGEIYNVGADNEWANIDLAKRLLKIMGKSEALLTSVKDRPGHDRRYAIDSSKLRRELGWMPSIAFDRGLEDTIGFYTTASS